MVGERVYRRRFLTLAGAVSASGVTGCAGRDDPASAGVTPTAEKTPTDAPTATTTDAPTATTTPWEHPPVIPFGFDVDVPNDRPSEDEPPKIRIAVTNESGEPYQLQTHDTAFPFSVKVASSDGTTLLLADDLSEWGYRDGECWAGTALSEPAETARTVDPGETVTAERAVVNAAEEYGGPPEACWPAASFEFVQSYAVHPADGRVSDPFEFEWGVRIQVDETPSIDVPTIGPSLSEG